MKVSILIPVFNSETFLGKTIDSALAQTWVDKEIIIVDDGSTDASLSIAKSYEVQGVKVYSQVNGGACKARNFAFEKSSGVYIQYLDADDLLSADKVESQMKLIPVLQHSDKVLSCAWEYFFKDQEIGNIQRPSRFLDCDWSDPIQWLCHSWEGKGMGQTSIWLIPRNLIEKAGPWNENLRINQDGEFMCRVLLVSKGIKFSHGGLVYYRSGNNKSVSQIKNYKSAVSLLLSYQLYKTNILFKEDSQRVRSALARNFRLFIYSNFGIYDDLVKTAWEELRQLNVADVPSVGGENFKRLTQLLGFTIALRLKYIFNYGFQFLRRHNA